MHGSERDRGGGSRGPLTSCFSLGSEGGASVVASPDPALSRRKSPVGPSSPEDNSSTARARYRFSRLCNASAPSHAEDQHQASNAEKDRRETRPIRQRGDNRRVIESVPPVLPRDHDPRRRLRSRQAGEEFLLLAIVGGRHAEPDAGWISLREQGWINSPERHR